MLVPRHLADLVALDKAPTVHVDDHALRRALASQQIKTAHSLSECVNNIPSVRDLLIGELRDETSLFAIGIPAH